MAQQLRLTKVGAVSVDGTKMQAYASKHAAVSYRRAGEMIEQLELEVKELLERAKQATGWSSPNPAIRADISCKLLAFAGKPRRTL